MKKRIILHFDMDYFFAQIEERENPHFKGKPIVVGADPKGGRGRGVVSTANYEARKFGIKSGMPISKAFKLCPKAIFLPVNMELYQKVSEKIMEIAKKYSPIFGQISLDEAYLDLSFLFHDRRKKEIVWEKAKKLGEKLKKEIFEKERLICTVGIGPNKLVAKIATNQAKPNGLLVITPQKVKSFLAPLDIEEIPGIGPKTAKRLKSLGIRTISQLRKLSKEKLKKMFGKVGERFFEAARGIDREPVLVKEIVKSVGKQITFEKDTRDPKIIFAEFEKIIKAVFQELKEGNFYCKGIVVLCRYFDFETHSKSKTFKKKTKNFKLIKREAEKFLLKFLLKSKKPLRLIGLRLKVS